MPDWGSVWCIEASPFDEATAYLVVDAHRLDDYRPHVWKTTDFGETWHRITEGLPADEYVRVVREDPKKKGHLYLGTERQVWHSPDAGKTWHPLKLNMPTVAVTDLVVKDDDLVVGTQGRSIWILDDLTPIREWTEGDRATRRRTRSRRPPAVRWQPARHRHRSPEGRRRRQPAGRAHVISYYLKEKAKKPLDDRSVQRQERTRRQDRGQGARSRARTPDDDEEDEDDEPKKLEIPGDKGINRFAWDLRHQGAEVIAKAKLDAGNPRKGPLVAPGTYTVKITADGKTFTDQGRSADGPARDRAARGREPEAAAAEDRHRAASRHRRRGGPTREGRVASSGETAWTSSATRPRSRNNSPCGCATT